MPWEVYMNREKIESWKGPTVPKEGMPALEKLQASKMTKQKDEKTRMTQNPKVTEDKKLKTSRMTEDPG